MSERVTFLGSVAKQDMGQYYGAADIFVLPSIARSEAFGIAQIEALASAIPVVNTALDSGVPDVSVDNVTGLTVPPNDPGALATALNRLLDDGQLARQFGAQGRRRALERFSADRMVDETLNLYEKVTASGGVPNLQARMG
jgi:rhamnosyl/mannosyltransferase